MGKGENNGKQHFLLVLQCFFFFFLFPCHSSNLTLKAPFTKKVPFVTSVDQDHAAQNMQLDLKSTLSAMLEHYSIKIDRNLPLSLP